MVELKRVLFAEDFAPRKKMRAQVESVKPDVPPPKLTDHVDSVCAATRIAEQIQGGEHLLPTLYAAVFAHPPAELLERLIQHKETRPFRRASEDVPWNLPATRYVSLYADELRLPPDLISRWLDRAARDIAARVAPAATHVLKEAQRDGSPSVRVFQRDRILANRVHMLGLYATISDHVQLCKEAQIYGVLLPNISPSSG